MTSSKDLPFRYDQAREMRRGNLLRGLVLGVLVLGGGLLLAERMLQISLR